MLSLLPAGLENVELLLAFLQRGNPTVLTCSATFNMKVDMDLL
eukprot:SAG31_NODE_1165_length_9578_cov_5.386011_4_plen_43_part_00